jgi:putative phage-type endonuclease
MKIINVEQGSKEWLEWRKSVITATDCPAIMGSSPWKTQYKCWQLKKGLIEEDKPNKAMEEGIRREPESRALFIKETGINMTPVVVESNEFNFLGASLDGISDCGKIILEIKCGGEKLTSMASHGIIPDYYLDQMQHQLLVTGAEKCIYDVYGKRIDVYPDPEFRDRFLPRARAFLKCMAFDEPPPMTLSDYKDMNDDISWKECANMYQEIDASLRILEERKDFLRKKLIGLCEEQSCQGSGLKVMKTTVKGRIVYDNIPEIKNLDLDKYRQGSTFVWKIIADKVKW